MKRIAIVIPAFVGCALVCRRRVRCRRRADFATRIAGKPDGTPAKWIFTNVTAIRQNTERILELLEQRSSAGPEAGAPSASGG